MKIAFGLFLLVISLSVQAQGDKKENRDTVVQKSSTKPAPLWIVDGIKMSDVQDAAKGRFLDINPSDIVTISVVKGDSALLYYGEAGRNGVILVTTKKASRKKSENHQ